MSGYSPSSTSADTVVSKIENFVSENRKAVVAGAVALAVVTAGGAGYYYYSSSSQRRGKTSDLEKGGKSKSKKKKSPKKKKLGEEGGPILEERTPRTATPSETGSEVDESAASLTKEQIEALPREERLTRANALKTKGNASYSARKFAAAVDLYTQAIEISPSPEAVYFSNRAACYVNYDPPQYENVVNDCNEALKRDPAYIKALNRRANALEQLDRLHESLQDFTTSTILEKFTNDTSSSSLERVLKKIAQKEAKETMASRGTKLPSYTFINAYLAAFRDRPLPALPESPSQGDETLIKALEALKAKNFAHAFTLASEALEQNISWKEGKAEALNLRGTMKFLCSDSVGAKADLQASLDADPDLVQSWVKIASVHMDMGDPAATFAAFDNAVKCKGGEGAKDPDVFYHRGQVYFIMQQFKEAESDYQTSISLDNSFIFSHIQLAVAQYKLEMLANSMASFRKTLKAFPNMSEGFNYYGELLLDQQRYADAMEKFDTAISIERKKSPTNVLPLVNKALATFQWQHDIATAEALLREALEIDPECDAAIATLAQLTLQQGKLDEAVEMFTKHGEVSRTEPELEQALTFKYATLAQQKFLVQFPHMGPELSQMARALQS